MIERKKLFHTEFYKHTHFSGSYLGMRYRIERIEKEDKSLAFLVTVFPGPYAFDATPEEQKETREFPFSDEALDQICDYLNETYASAPDRWETGRIIR